MCSRKAYQLFEDAKLDFPNLNREQLDKLDRELAGLLAKGRLLDDRITHLERRYPVSFEQWLETHPLPVDFDMKVREQYARTEEELKDVNWQLLRTYFGNQLAPKSTIYAANVLQHDQTTRLIWLVGSLVIFLISGSLVNLNATSLQGYYRDGISNVWIDEVPGFGRSIPLTSLDTTSRGAPYHLVNATVHLMGRRLDMDQPVTDAFLFSRCYCGSKRTGFSPTDEYDDGRYDLPNAIAVSGAAVTPSQVHNPLLAVLLFISNSRLGQWLPNPAYNNRFARTVNKRLRLPFSPIRLMIGLFQPAERRNHCFVADGGHHENLGLEVLLERRVRTIIVSDVTCDFNYQFEDLVQLHRRIAARLGIRIDGFSERDDFLDLAPLVPDKETRFSRQHVICARIRYPRLEYLGEFGEPMQGLLLYVKPGLTGDEPLDLRSHQEHSPMFPHDTTADQFYDPDRFESYRQLGFHIGQELSKVYQERIRSTDVSDHGGKPGGHRPSVIGTAGTSSNGDSEDGDNDNSQRDLHFLIQRLSHENSDYRLLAIHAIGELIPALNANAKQNAVRALTDVLSQPTSDKSLLEKTVWALGEAGLGIASEAERIMAFVENHEGDVRICAAALELLRDVISESDELREHLERLRRDSSPMIQQKAAVLLNEQTAE